MTKEEKYQRRQQLREVLSEKYRIYETKSNRAKTQEKRDYWWNRYQTVSRFLWKNTYIPTYMTSFGVIEQWGKGLFNSPERWKETTAERREKGRLTWLNSHYFSMWFISNSVGADYGKYACDRCSRTFYHSPSTITKAGKTVFNCACGYCTNEIIQRDHDSLPYSN